MSGSDDRLDQLDYYTLLGVARDAGVDDIKRAFRTFARRYHPDRHAGGDAEKIDRATRIYRRGSEAVQTLTSLESRRAYDAGLAKGELRLKSVARAAPIARDQPGVGAPRRAPDPAARPAAAPTISSPSARAFFTKAQESARAGDLKAAHRHLASAMAQEPGNPLLEQALIKIERALRGW
ncbi:MAG: DnaJ domain-containing protein [Myxococcota bacterium]|nr:DnaJ domain-containing protein [Myxococcota bacterium]